MYSEVEKLHLQMISLSFKKHEGVVKIHTSNSELHELAKARVCYYLQQNDRKFVTEARLNNGLRPDIFDLTKGVAYEIVHKESDKSIEVKKENYGIMVVRIDASELLMQEPEDLCRYLD